MSRTRLYAPTDATPGGSAARRLVRLIGPALRAADGTAAAALLLGLGDGLATARARLRAALDEAFADTALETLSEWEALVGLPTREGASPDDRRRDLLAKIRAAFSGAPSDILRTVRTYAPEALLATVPVAVALLSYPRGVFRFVLLISDAHWRDTSMVASIDARLQQQSPAHVDWSVAEGEGPDIPVFLCDSPDSLCDRNVLSE